MRDECNHHSAIPSSLAGTCSERRQFLPQDWRKNHIWKEIPNLGIVYSQCFCIENMAGKLRENYDAKFLEAIDFAFKKCNMIGSFRACACKKYRTLFSRLVSGPFSGRGKRESRKRTKKKSSSWGTNLLHATSPSKLKQSKYSWYTSLGLVRVQVSSCELFMGPVSAIK